MGVMYNMIEVSKYDSLQGLVTAWVSKDKTNSLTYSRLYDKILVDINSGIFAYLLNVNPVIDSVEDYSNTVRMTSLVSVITSGSTLEEHTGKFYTDFVNQKFKN
jgi:hypothetical protein